MTMRRKILLVSGVTLVSMITTLYLVTRFVIMETVTDSEQHITRQNLERVQHALANRLEELDRILINWAQVEETGSPSPDRIPTFLQTNLSDPAFGNFNLNAVAFLSPQGKLVYSQGYDLHSRQPAPFPNSLAQRLRPEEGWVAAPLAGSARAGYLWLPEGPFMLALRPVRAKADTSLVQGVILIGYFLDADQVAAIENLTQLTIQLHRPDDPQLPPDFRTVLPTLQPDEPVFGYPLDAATVSGYALLTGLDGKALLLRVDTWRDIYQQGLEGLRFFLFSYIVIGLVFFGLALYGLETLVLARLSSLNGQLKTIGASSDFSQRVSLSGGDELAQLTTSLNDTFWALQQAQAGQHAIQEQLRRYVEETPDLIYTIQNNEQGDPIIAAFNPAFETITGWPRAAWIGRKLVDLVYPEDWPQVVAYVQEITPGHSLEPLQLRILAKDGRYLVVELTSTAQVATGNTVSVIGTARDITARARAEARVATMNRAFLSFTADPKENINRLTGLCGELLEADCALYNRLDKKLLCSWGQWNTPLDYKAVDTPEGHICYDLLRTGEDLLIVRNLPATSYARTDPNVIPYGLKTYIGKTVRLGELPVGSLCAVYQRDLTFSADERNLIGIIASAIAVEEKRLWAEKTRSSSYRISEAASATSSLEEVFQLIHSILGELMPVDNFFIALYDPTSDTLRFPYFIDQYDENPPPQKPGKGLTEYVLRTARPLLAPPEVFAELLHSGEVEEIGAPSIDWLGVPLKDKEQTIGILAVQSYSEKVRFGEHEKAVLEFVSTQVALAITRKQAEEALAQHAREMAALYETTLEINAHLEVSALLKAIVQRAAGLLYAHMGALYLIRPDRQSLELVVSYNLPKDYTGTVLRLGEGLSGKIAQTGLPLAVKDYQHWDGQASVFNGFPFRRVLGVPMKVGDRLIGVINIADDIKTGSFDEHEIRLVSLFADQAAIALENVRLFDAGQIELRVRRQTELALRRREAILEAVGFAAGQFLKTATWKDCIPAVIERLGLATDVSRVYIFENHSGVDGELLCSQRFEWARAGVSQEIDNPILQNASYNIPSFSRLRRLFTDGKMYYGNIAEFPPAEQEMLGPQGILSLVCMPIFVGKQWWGFMGYDDCANERQWQVSEREALRAAADILGASIQREQAEEEIRRQTTRAQALLRIADRLNAQLDLQTVLNTVCEEAAHALNIPVAMVDLYDRKDHQLVTAANYGLPPSFIQRLAPLPERAFSHYLGKQSCFVIPDVQALEDQVNQALYLEFGLRTLVNTTMAREGEMVGTLNVASLHTVHQFTKDELALLDGLANQAAQAIVNARLYEEAQHRLLRVQALRNIDIAISASLDLNVTLYVILDQITAQLKVDAAVVLLLNPQTLMLDYAGGRGLRTGALQRTSLRLGESFAGRAALERSMIHIPELRSSKTSFLRSPEFAKEGFITYFGVPLLAKGQVLGVLEIFHRSQLDPEPEWSEYLEVLATQTAIAINNAQLFDNLQRSNLDLTLAYDVTLEGWSKALELRDFETKGHSQRVTDLTLRLARQLHLGEESLLNIRRGTLLHDIGKMAIPDGILFKPGPLNEAEWATMRQHPVYAYDLLAPIVFLRPALDIPYCHHEHWDGGGYPRRLRGEQIPLAARLFAVVDVWDALLSDRPYRLAWSEDQALAHIRSQAGKQFDPKVVEVFIQMITQSG